MPTHVLEYLEASALRHPEKTAFADERDSVGYGQLLSQSRKIASALGALLPSRNPVAFCTAKNVGTIAGFLGTALAGCFYVQLDLQQPLPRLKEILRVLNPGVLVTDGDGLALAQSLEAACPLRTLESLIEANVDEELLAARRQDHTDLDPLYCSFTSGSTGIPKGVLVSHRSVLDFIDAFVPLFGIDGDDVFGNQAPLDFDISVKDLYGGLKAGARVELIPRKRFSFPVRLAEYLEERKVTTLVWAVSALCILSGRRCLEAVHPSSIRKVLFSGEVMPPVHLSYWQSHYPEALFVNLYGPTEITCNCTYHMVERQYGPEETIPMGRAFPNEGVFLLDEEEQLIEEADRTGELCVRGSCLALGYYNDPERTRAAFVPNPLNSRWEETIYRTGDMVRRRQDGLFVYVGRRDFQIKHLGHRIELGEIESVMGALPGVDRVCVLYMEEEQKIVAFYEGGADWKGLYGNLRERLPQYMVPGEVLQLGELPLNKNGKIDRALLRERRQSGAYKEAR